jgi:ATP-dependent Lon protease
MYQKRTNEINNSLKLKNIFDNTNINDVKEFIKDKNKYIQEIIRSTILSIKKHKYHDIFSNNDASLSITVLNDLYEKTNEIVLKLDDATCNNEKIIELLQKIIDKLSMIICGFGTEKIDDLLFISFGSQFTYIKIENEFIKEKYELIRKYIHPIGYKIIHWKNKTTYRPTFTLCSNKLDTTTPNIESSCMFECYDVESNIKAFYQKVYGIRVIIQNESLQKTLIINGVIDDIQLECFTNSYVNLRKQELKRNADAFAENEKELIMQIIDSLTLKEILVCGNEDIYKKSIAIRSEINLIKNNKLDISIKRFLESDLFSQRNILVNMLTYNNDDDNETQYICYLLYDLLSINESENIDDAEQFMIYESFPWKIKSIFKDAIKYTIKYTNNMIQKFDINKISLEQQIYLMKASDNVKEKAMAKLKEIKGKPDEFGVKAKHYLEGLTKIPFGIYKEEPILKKIKDINCSFKRILKTYETLVGDGPLSKKEKYTNSEIIKFIKFAKHKTYENVGKFIKENTEHQNSKTLITILKLINKFKKTRTAITKLTKENQIKEIFKFLDLKLESNAVLIDIYDLIKTNTSLSLSKMISELSDLNNKIESVDGSVQDINTVLDKSIYSHSYAKNQILKIIGQWINGEQRGYSFGFEGSPGIGKTSLAKNGLAHCLVDENGVSRPFHFIALGGSANGSTLEGYGYTYVNSTWGRIVDILIESKCMNPIIYIDELDKVSKTDAGKEIVGILTHLIDTTQNDSFQDKYFAGINIDLSKVLFIFSYNDPENIDKILLDRIHRIKFDNLLLDDKIVIVKKYIVPEINKNMGFEDIIVLSDEVIEYIIENYTSEPGVRKLKEIIFDLYGEINIELLKCKDIEIPIHITKDMLDSKYLIKYHKIETKKIHSKHEIGVINGLWANTLGRGGIIPIQTMFFPSTTFLDLKLTGLQGDVMKESMNVAKTLAWELTPLERKKELLKQFEETKCQGLHIHCPEGAVSKDGPSAGVAITVAIYSLFNQIPVLNTVAITGEINLQGEVTAIGGLDLKILGGIAAGVKTFLYPSKNNREFIDFMDKYKDKPILEGISFKEICMIKDVCKYVFVKGNS